MAPQLRTLLPRTTQPELIAQYQNWDAESQRKALDHGSGQPGSRPRTGSSTAAIPDCDGMPHDEWEWNHARADQQASTEGERTGSPVAGPRWPGLGARPARWGVRLAHVMSTVSPRIALVAPTGADVRDTMIEGVSGILATASPDRIPHWEPSKRRLTWPATKNIPECIATTFSAEEPDRLRGSPVPLGLGRGGCSHAAHQRRVVQPAARAAAHRSRRTPAVRRHHHPHPHPSG